MRRTITFLLILIATTSLMAQNFSYTNFTTSNGLPANDILSICADNAGNIWVGTNGSGVGKYNGSSWTTYTTAQGLAGNTVKGIIQATNGDMWFATTNGLSHYNGVSWDTQNTADGLPTNDLKCVYQSANGNIWVGTAGSGVCKLVGSTWTTYNTVSGLAQNFVQAITQDFSGNMWFATAVGVSKYTGSAWTTYTSSNGLIADGDEVISAMTDKEGNVWFGSKPGFGIGGGLSKYNGSTWSTYNNTNGLANNQVTSMDCDAQNRCWFGTFVNGASKYNGTAFSTFSAASGLVGNAVQCVDVAPDGYVWFGTTAGVSRLSTVVYHSATIGHNTCGLADVGSITIAGGTINTPMYYSIDGGATYQTGSNFTDLTSGSYDIFITDSSLFVDCPDVTILDIPIMSIGLPDTFQVCIGTATTIDLADPSFTLYDWEPDSIFTINNQYNPTVNAYTPQNVHVTALDTNGCMTSDDVYLEINALPVFTVTITDDSIFTVDAPFDSYQWYRYSDLILGADQITYTASEPGIYYVQVTNAIGCSNMSGMIHYDNTGIDDATDANTKIFASHGLLYFEFDKEGVYQIALWNTMSQKIISWESSVKSGSFTLPQINAGIYYVTILDGRHLFTRQILID